jgi:hypothetical protein
MPIFCVVLQVGQCFVLLDCKVRLPVLETKAVGHNLEIAQSGSDANAVLVDLTDY